jgi:hypothetical protein
MYVIETEREDDGRWIAEVPELSGVQVYGVSREEAGAESSGPFAASSRRAARKREALPQVQNVFAIVA